MKESLVDDYFDEEKEIESCTIEEYYDNFRKCLRYHYTNVNAVTEILDSKNIRLMHFEGMNDTSEGKFLLEELKDEVKDFDEKYQILTNHLYIGCFSFYGNQLSQWCRYGDVNIGFNWENMKFDQKFIVDAETPDKPFLHTAGVELTECKYVSYNVNMCHIKMTTITRF